MEKWKRLPDENEQEAYRVCGGDRMMNILFVNACVRQNSRTKRLADEVLARLGGEVTEIDLQQEAIHPLTAATLKKRDSLAAKNDFEDEMFRYARLLAKADKLVIAAPYWDLSFPSLLKVFIESVNVVGLTFAYGENGVPYGLCRADEMIYITTAGGHIVSDEFGYGYLQRQCEMFYGIPHTTCIKAEGLDVVGADVDQILADAKKEIDIKLNGTLSKIHHKGRNNNE